jgi:hypothetical protein
MTTAIIQKNRWLTGGRRRRRGNEKGFDRATERSVWRTSIRERKWQKRRIKRCKERERGKRNGDGGGRGKDPKVAHRKFKCAEKTDRKEDWWITVIPGGIKHPRIQRKALGWPMRCQKQPKHVDSIRSRRPPLKLRSQQWLGQIEREKARGGPLTKPTKTI